MREGMMEARTPDESQSDSIVINEVQLLLAEKRTSLASMRTGIAALALPISVLSLLIATSNYYEIIHVVHLILPLFLICGALIVLSAYLIFRSIFKIRHYDKLIMHIKLKHSKIAEFID